MEEESFSAENVCYESYDSTGKKSVQRQFQILMEQLPLKMTQKGVL